MIYLFAQCGCARPLPGWFPHHGFLWIQFIAPAIELTPRYSQLLCQCHDVLASSQSLHSHLPEVLRIPSLCHLQFLSCKVCLVLLSHFWGSLHPCKWVQTPATRAKSLQVEIDVELCACATCSIRLLVFPIAWFELRSNRSGVRISPGAPDFNNLQIGPFRPVFKT